MPIGTPVLAARDGIVLSVFDGFPEGKLDEKYRDMANEVTVLHEDGTLGIYSHLSSGISVQEGKKLDVGAQLGFSGNSGYSGSPHLHFGVKVQRLARKATSIPIQFRGRVLPVEGQRYGPYSSMSFDSAL